MNTREGLLKHLEKNTKVLRDGNIKRALECVDRADFVPGELTNEAYEDYPLPIGYDQTISQPTTVAFMLEKLCAQKGDRVLDVGSGSGWTTALLTEIVGTGGEVFGVEHVPKLVKMGQKNLSKYNFKNAGIEQAGPLLGMPSKGPFDRILVSAAAHRDVPQELIDQLMPGGRMVIPVDDKIVEVEKSQDGSVVQKTNHGFVFVPLISKEETEF